MKPAPVREAPRSRRAFAIFTARPASKPQAAKRSEQVCAVHGIRGAPVHPGPFRAHSTRRRNSRVRGWAGWGEQLFRCALLDDDALVHEHHAVGHVAGERHLVGDHQHRQARRRQPAHDVEHLADHLGVEGRGRLVEQQHLGVHGEGAGDGDALLLTAGELARLGVDERLHAHALEEPHRVLLALGAAAAQRLHLTDDAVLQHVHVGEEVELLKDHADAGAVARQVEARRADGLAAVLDRAAVGRFEAVHAAQQRGLAGAAGADDAHDLAGAHVEVDVAQHAVVAEGLAQVAHGEDGLRAFAHRASPPFSFSSPSGTVWEPWMV